MISVHFFMFIGLTLMLMLFARSQNSLIDYLSRYPLLPKKNVEYEELCQPTDPAPIGCGMVEIHTAICFGKRTNKISNKCICKPGKAHPVLLDGSRNKTVCKSACFHEDCGDVGYCHGTVGVGNYICECPKGYMFNGSQCQVIPECDQNDHFCPFVQRCIPKIYKCESRCNHSSPQCSVCNPLEKSILGCNMTSNENVKCLESHIKNVPNLCLCEGGYIHPSPQPGIIDTSVCIEQCAHYDCGNQFGGGTCVGGYATGKYHCLCPEGQIFARNTCLVNAACLNETTFFCAKAKKCISWEFVCDSHDDCGDGSDEIKCSLVNNSNTIPCGDGFFVKKIALCDGELDCANGYDELMCDSTVCKDNEFRCAKGRCIPKESVCDFIVDCSLDEDISDASDEENCYDQYPKCKEEEFECRNRQCIKASQRCDKKLDCFDFSDEEGCFTCKEDEFRCYPSDNCINIRWFCDGEHDCVNGFDEWPTICTEKETCKENEFQCFIGQCLPGKYRCDGIVDCIMGADEDSCSNGTAATRVCEEYQFQCKSHHSLFGRNSSGDKPGECIPMALRCDGKKHCPDASDEENCTSIHNHCNDKLMYADCDEFSCYHINRRCDGITHCKNGADELGCPLKCKAGLSKCGNSSECINNWKICDGEIDCKNKWDESPLCNINECLNDSTHCEGICLDLPIGFTCACNSGYEIGPDGFSCVDVNECETPGRCSQLCENFIGGFLCSCKIGYDLINGRYCKSKGQDTYAFLIENRHLVYHVIDGSSNDAKVLVSKIRDDVTSMVSDFYLEYFFISTYSKHQKFSEINRVSIANPQIYETIYTEDYCHIKDMRFDWITKNLYFIDAINQSINVVDSETYIHSTIFTNTMNPYSLVLDARTGEYLMYWLELNNLDNSSIHVASMDGSSRRILIMLYPSIPHDLAIDFTTSRLFWLDIVTNTIRSCDLMGQNVRLVLELPPLSRPNSLQVFEDSIYWVSMNEKVVKRANKFNGRMEGFLFKDLKEIMKFTLYNKELMPKHHWNPCEAMPCAQLCLLVHPNNFTCACANGITLLKDGISCNTSDAYVCTKSFCENNGICINTTKDGKMIIPYCKCKRGYGGRRCEDSVEYLDGVYEHGDLVRLKCIHGYCENDGSCIEVDEYGEYLFRPICKCREGYMGKRCQLVDYYEQNRKHVLAINTPIPVKSTQENAVKKKNTLRLPIALVCGFVAALFLAILMYYVYKHYYFKENLSPQELEDQNIYLNPIYRPTTVSYSVPPCYDETFL